MPEWPKAKTAAHSIYIFPLKNVYIPLSPSLSPRPSLFSFERVPPAWRFLFDCLLAFLLPCLFASLLLPCFLFCVYVVFLWTWSVSSLHILHLYVWFWFLYFRLLFLSSPTMQNGLSTSSFASFPMCMEVLFGQSLCSLLHSFLLRIYLSVATCIILLYAWEPLCFDPLLSRLRARRVFFVVWL